MDVGHHRADRLSTAQAANTGGREETPHRSERAGRARPHEHSPYACDRHATAEKRARRLRRRDRALRTPNRSLRSPCSNQDPRLPQRRQRDRPFWAPSSHLPDDQQEPPLAVAGAPPYRAAVPASESLPPRAQTSFRTPPRLIATPARHLSCAGEHVSSQMPKAPAHDTNLRFGRSASATDVVAEAQGSTNSLSGRCAPRVWRLVEPRGRGTRDLHGRPVGTRRGTNAWLHVSGWGRHSPPGSAPSGPAHEKESRRD
jgi:hypothetical protein